MAGKSKSGKTKSSKSKSSKSKGGAKAARRKTARRSSPATRPAAEAASAAAPHPYALPDDEVEAALATGERSGLLEDYFGAAQYAELRQLAQDAAMRSVRGGKRVLILPGIMGSKLGPSSSNAIWLDPLDIAFGRLASLSLRDGNSRIHAIGVILFAYLKLKLRLRIAGFDAAFHPFDWRKSLDVLGTELAARIRREGTPGSPVHLVAHSMGGLVARATLDKPTGGHLGRIVMLGTPNYGSFSPIQAFRGTHSLVGKLAFLDQRHTKEELARNIFGTFPGLCEMMPSPEKFSTDFFDTAAWPGIGVVPDAEMLADAADVQMNLPTEHDDIVIIAGVNQQTVVDATIENDEFVYSLSSSGDGTVPLKCVLLSGARKTYFVEEEHGSLPNNNLVGRAVEEILATGETTRLPDSYDGSRAATPVRRLREREIREPAYEGDPGRALSTREQRLLLEEFAAPDRAAATAGVATGLGEADGFSNNVVIGRSRQHRLDITLAFGNIVDVEASAYVLGAFRHVSPDGAARAVDDLLDGAISTMVSRRMFNANVGEVSILPTGRHPIRADLVAFAGLGPFDQFQDEVLDVVGENLVRTFASTRVDNFATVPLGGGSGKMTLAALRHLLTGFLRGLVDVDKEQRFRSITICEIDRDRFNVIRNELYQLCATPLFDGVEVTLREKELPPRSLGLPSRAERPAGPASIYLMVRQETSDRLAARANRAKTFELGASVLTTGAKATVFKGRQSVNRDELDRLLRRIEASDFTASKLADFGDKLARLVLPESVRKILERFDEHPWVIVHDAEASRIPWETLRIGNNAPALKFGLSHRYEAENLAVAKWMEQRQHGKVLDVLLVVDPTEDLPGAAKEGKRLAKIFQKLGPSVQVKTLQGQQARKAELLRCFSSGQFDMVHYAGHAFFDPLRPARSGIICNGEEVLSGADLASVASLPSLVFFNACEAARVRKRGQKSTPIPDRVQRNVSFAEAFLRGGVANYVGTYWPVGDAAAEAFAGAFYDRLMQGETLGQAILKGRQAVHAKGSVDWADYVHYGNPEFVLKYRD